jgi:lambda family phage tail tape measure protein
MLRERAERLQAIEDMRQQQRLQEQLASTMTNLFMAATRGADAFKQALAGVLTQLAQMLANRAFTALFEGFGSGGGAGGGLFSALRRLFGFANGGAFVGGNVVPFAKGGVVNSPTTFPMSRNRTGLMGEAGPEAVIPLRRGRDGKLGVGAEPQNVAVDVRVHVDDNGNWRSNVERIADSRISRAAPQIVSQSVQSTYAASSERRFR